MTDEAQPIGSHIGSIHVASRHPDPSLSAPHSASRATKKARRVAGPIDETIVAEPIDDGTYIVIVTRGHRHDEQVLKAVAVQPARYIGMIGSRRKVKLTFDELRVTRGDRLEIHATGDIRKVNEAEIPRRAHHLPAG